MENATSEALARSASLCWTNQPSVLHVTLGVIFIYACKILFSGNDKIRAPVVGYRAWWEPGWLVGLRFFRNSVDMVNEGYQKYNASMFSIRRNDSNILVIPSRHVEYLRNLPEDEISGMKAHIKNMSGPYTNTEILLESNLASRVLQQRLTPNLASAVPNMKDELDYALEVEVPDCQDEWVSVSVHDIILRIISRVSARVFVGPSACRNEEWLFTCVHYTENVYEVIILLRMLPPSLHTLVAPLLPAYWRIRRDQATARRILCPMVQARRAEQESNGSIAKPDDLLQWMMDMGDANETRNDKLAHRQLVLSLAAIHTSSMATTHAVYDLCAHPEYLEPLRAELQSTLEETGGWSKPIIPRLRKLDSFLKESQRLNPPAIVAFNRIVCTPTRLPDGTALPAGTHFCMASSATQNDPANLPHNPKRDLDANNPYDPTAFDPFRWAHLRDDPAHPENAHRFQFATTDSSSLHFGHGRFACPGRFYASQQIKMIFAHLLLLYDFKYPEGQKRPRNLCSDENLYPDPAARVMIRRRR
ncbi:cytochrome P450 [Xylariaceae sp. FL0016]|nr:cytochrome P450 [Xylariaceae sp. FL0016]